MLYHVRENQHSLYLSFPSFVQFSLSPIKFFVTDFSAPMTARITKFCIHLQTVEVYCIKENHDAEIYFAFLLLFFFFSISHSNVMHREICVKGFSGITAPRILKFGANIGYDYLYRVRENQHPHVYHSLYLSIFFLFVKYFSGSTAPRILKF